MYKGGNIKGILLAGGSGTRLYPITFAISKQLLPVYDKPLIYYPLSTLMMCGIKDILIISTPSDLPRYETLFKNGAHIGLNISYAEQKKPKGIADALRIGKSFINNENVCLILGDNLYFGHGLQDLLMQSRKKVEENDGALIFGYYVRDPRRYGVVDFDSQGNVTSLDEKPLEPRSNYAITGLYFYDRNAVEIAETIAPSARGEFEITDVNKEYLKKGHLKAIKMGRGFAWFDTGTFDSLLEAADFICAIEKRQGLKVACIEEIAYRLGYITKQQLIDLGKNFSKNSYGKYILNIAEDN